MNTLITFMNRPYAIRGAYLLSALLILLGLLNVYNEVTTSAFFTLTACVVFSLACLFLLNISTRRAHCLLLSQANAQAMNYLAGDEVEASINSVLSDPLVLEFIVNYNQLIQGADSSRHFFANIALHLGQEAQSVSNASVEINAMMEQQLTSTGQVQTTLMQLQTAMSLANEVAGKTYELAQQSETEGSSGKLVMTDAITGVMMLSDSVNKAGAIIKKLGDDSKTIASVIDVITGVADQTNLLALNAAIEAARAGEQGRGFAVVADEVRSLASQTQASAQKINDIISTLLKHVDDAVSVIDKSVEQADHADELMESVTISYSEIVGLMVEVSTHSTRLIDAGFSSGKAVDEAADNLDLILASAEESTLKANMLVAGSMELGKLGEQLTAMTSAKNAPNAANLSEADGVKVDDNTELF